MGIAEGSASMAARILLMLLALQASWCFTLPCRLSGRCAVHRAASPSMNLFNKFLQELDNFADDAMGRRLGNGAKFYGKRRSTFYGEDDEQRKEDPQAFDREEDYSGPAGGSYFVLSKERDEQGRPMGFLTRKEARELERQEEAAAAQGVREASVELNEEFFAALAREEAQAQAASREEQKYDA